jgi:carbon storage regulator
MIGEDVSVTVLRVKGNQIRLGVNAPKNVSVQREEVFERMKEEGDAPSLPGLHEPHDGDELPQAHIAADFAR